ncbi:sensor domain-containing diguanylate cyclase [Azotobacter armeniacus]
MSLKGALVTSGELAVRPGEVLSALRQAQTEMRRLQAREQLFGMLLASVNAVLWAYDWQARRMLYLSPAYERIFGRPSGPLPDALAGWLECVHPDDRDYVLGSLGEVFDKGAVEQREYRIIRGDGQLRWLNDKCYCGDPDESGRARIIVGLAEDITERKQLEGELQRLASTDGLTRSSNRRHFFECAQRELQLARQYGTSLAFLLLDIDDFKRINDTHGHQVGDQVLQRLADCCATTLRGGDLFGRIGGEEFAALFPRCRPEQALPIAERLQRSIGELVFHAGGDTFRITVSQGLVGLGPDDDLGALYARADAAMYQAKQQGKDRVVLL